ncbi:SAM-dependent methyltransferase [Actinoplanes campanulatus]|uniref:SAM-dependent methyltransferase n=1 Tax=Actinoplanes campanulatus TaxID=113559 RepID=A0A7W5FDE9_9ACTN|nr:MULTISPECIES: class I SAM-dependent methyltransferase [Actinoplanes]MBB3094226.1 SAM-dependent methyltransferase [Actinoplanes campanulatus]GGN43023.1 methyltransferase [Actinoplanes campanulatus]GID35854.1 methyltransferase [Actinoplanes campanulatus]
MLTVDYDRLDVRPGMRVLDLGCGEGRHTFEAYRRGAHVVALDLSEKDLGTTRQWCAAMDMAGEAPAAASATTVRGDLLALPFPDASFDRVIASEVMEHIPDDVTAIAELTRVLKPGGLAAVTVPRWLPERVCWALSDEYHANEGGHVRIYKEDELSGRLRDAGLTVTGNGFAHALHSPYWWLKCAIGDAAPTRAYHKLLVWDIVDRPALTRVLEQALNPLIGKSVVIYLRKEEVAASVAA